MSDALVTLHVFDVEVEYFGNSHPIRKMTLRVGVKETGVIEKTVQACIRDILKEQIAQDANYTVLGCAYVTTTEIARSEPATVKMEFTNIPGSMVSELDWYMRYLKYCKEFRKSQRKTDSKSTRVSGHACCYHADQDSFDRCCVCNDILTTEVHPKHETETCCQCGSEMVVYHNYLEQPFCSACANGEESASEPLTYEEWFKLHRHDASRKHEGS